MTAQLPVFETTENQVYYISIVDVNFVKVRETFFLFSA